MTNITTLLDKLSRFWETANLMDSEVVSLTILFDRIHVHLNETGFRSIVKQYDINLNAAKRLQHQGREHVRVEHDGIYFNTILSKGKSL